MSGGDEVSEQTIEASGKKIIESKTFWLNLIALLLGAYNLATGSNIIMSPELIATILPILNIAVRAITKEPVNWTK